MLEHAPHQRPIHVMVATPSATAGQGGIDRVMAELKAQLGLENSDDLSVKFVATRGAGSSVFSPFYTLGFCLRMIAAKVRGTVDVVHVNLASDGSTFRKLLISSCARLLRVPYVVHLHGAEYREFWERSNTFVDRNIRTMFESASRVVVLGNVWRQFVQARAPGAAEKIVIIPNATPVPTLERHSGAGTANILFLGRIGDRKGVPQLLDALGSMSGLSGWHATLAGDGQVDAAHEKATTLGILERVAFPGWVGPSEVARLIASSDILVLPSFAENLPMSVIEGMAAGLAIVATPVGAVPDIIVDGETGLLVPPGDVSALAAALTRLVENPELRSRLGRNGQAVHREKLDIAPFTRAIRETWIAAARGHAQ